MAWIVFLVFALPVLVFVVWLLLEKSFVNVPVGSLGLIVLRGRATDRALLPGRHFVPSFRRMMVVEYPSLELSYLAGDPRAGSSSGSELEHTDPPLRATLGDRAEVTVSYTVRFRLLADRLRSIHERFGQAGIWAIVRDQSRRAVLETLSDPAFSIGNTFGEARSQLEAALDAAVESALTAEGLVLTLFSLREIDLGRTGEVIQATVRSHAELEREEGAAATRAARARNDADLYARLESTLTDAVLRHQQIDVWRELVERWDTRTGVTADRTATSAASVVPPAAQPAAERALEPLARREERTTEGTTP